MAPSQVLAEKRPCAARASPSGRDCRMLNGEFEAGAVATPAAARMLSKLTGANHGIDFRNVLANFVAKTLHQAARDHQFACAPEVFCWAISRIVLTDSCWALSMNEQVLTTITSASSALGDQFRSGLRQHAHHHLAVHQVFGAPQADEANLGGLRPWVFSSVQERNW